VSEILLVDDVSTYGDTLSAAAAALWEQNPDLVIHAATAGQMILTSTVSDRRRLRAIG
jgi:predicted amidophosphoribosyltransferase